MRNGGVSRLAFLALVLVPASVGCASTVRGSNENAAADVGLTVTIENQSPAPVVVFFNLRAGTPYVRLGRVQSIERRVFRLPVQSVTDAELRLRAIHDRTLHNAVTDYMTLPLEVDGLSEVQWLLQDGRSLSPVTVR